MTRTTTIDAADKAGVRVLKNQQHEVVRSVATHVNPMELGARWAAACARFQRITQHMGVSSTFNGAIEDAEFPKLARECVELWANFETRFTPGPLVGADPNPFRGMTEIDAARKFMVMAEQVCDRSVRWLGAWS